MERAWLVSAILVSMQIESVVGISETAGLIKKLNKHTYPW